MFVGLGRHDSPVADAVIVGAVGALVFARKPAKAADLGGDCCADLEDRVAELEATTVRKGNKRSQCRSTAALVRRRRRAKYLFREELHGVDRLRPQRLGQDFPGFGLQAPH